MGEGTEAGCLGFALIMSILSTLAYVQFVRWGWHTDWYVWVCLAMPWLYLVWFGIRRRRSSEGEQE